MDILHQILLIIISVCGCGCVLSPYHENSNFNSNTTARRALIVQRRSGSAVWGTTDSNRRPLPYASRNSTRGNADIIVFPNDGPPPPPHIQSCPNGTKFCENADDYPSDFLEGLLKNSAVEYRGLFGQDAVEDPFPPLTQRTGDEDIATPLCASTIELIFPKKAEDKNGKWKYIVNDGKDYIQGVRVEKCRSAQQPCDYADSFPSGTRSFCKQNYIYRKLVAYNNDSNELEPMEFPIPSCCMCFVTPDLAIRSGSARQSTGSRKSTSRSSK